MLDFGTSGGHSNRLYLGDIYDAPTSYTYFFFIVPDDLGQHSMHGKWNGSADGRYLRWRTTTEELEVVHGDGASETAQSSSSGVDGVLSSWMVHWDGSNADFYKDGVADGTPVMNRAIGSISNNFTLGNFNQTGTVGAAGHLGQFMYWHNEDRSADITDLHTGQLIPGFDNLDVWHRGTANPGDDESPAANGAFTASGSVGLTPNGVDSYYIDSGGFRWILACMIPWVAPVGVKALFGANITYQETWKFMSQTLGRKHLGGDFRDLWEPLRDYLRRGTVYV